MPRGSPASERSISTAGSGRSVTFPVQHLEWVNGEWRATITTDLDDQRRGEEEGRSEKGRSVGTRLGLPSSSSDVVLLQVQLRKDRGRAFQFPSLKSKMRIQSGQRRMVQVDFLSTSRFGARDTTTS